ncbi:MAG: membrane protein insertase YidC [Lachnospira sp.]
MLDALYNLFVMPIQILVEITYTIMRNLLHYKGLAIIGVSLVVQTLILPLYKRSDALQDEEREKQAQMAHWVKHIKKTFKGDEQFMMLSTYYRQQNYKTWYSLKSSLSILLQVPFFLAAYNYLSNLSELNGTEFLFIQDLGKPDGIINVFGITLNLLPLLMTFFNILSGIIYTKGLPMGSKVQVYGLAAVFLVLLYQSPSGLVLYWTMNNLYSLLKNVFMKLIKNTRLVRALSRKPGFVKAVSRKLDTVNISRYTYICEVIFLTILMGVLIPMSVISSSPTEFIIDSRSPLQLVARDFFIYAGLFLVWFSVFYMLMSKNARKGFCIVLSFVCVSGLMNYMFFDGKYGMMNQLLVYDSFPVFSVMNIVINTLAVLAIAVVFIFVMLKKSVIIKRIIQIGILSMAVLSVVNYTSVKKNMDKYEECMSGKADSEEKIITLSKEGKNVVVLMLDRAIGAYMKYAVDDCEELIEQFDGFTYYPNTMSFGAHTNYATPAVFGGYEYTPWEINKRKDESLVSKQNESLTVMPLLFAQNGFDVTVCDPPYSNYQWSADVSIYDDYEDIDGYVLEGAYSDRQVDYAKTTGKGLQASNFVYYSMMRVMPLAFQKGVYNKGNYCSTVSNSEVSYLVTEPFTNWYTALLSLPDITEIVDGDEDTFLMMQNSITHEPNVMKVPEFVPSDKINAEEIIKNSPEKTVDGETMIMGDEEKVTHYHTFVVSLKTLGEWLDFMKENDVYDNTRIIIVSDHGSAFGQFDYMQLDNGVDAEFYNPLLLVKDFNETGYKTSDEFMTNADVPTLAVSGVIDNPVNPFTGKLISNEIKYKEPQRLTTAHNWDTKLNNGNVFDMKGGNWYDVDTNMFDSKHWKQVKE